MSENNSQQPSDPYEPPGANVVGAETLQGKSRHGCLTAWLILMLVSNAAIAVMYLGGSGAMADVDGGLPGWYLPLMGIAGIWNIVCVVALFKWKKWGFWGFCASSALALVCNMVVGLGVVASVSGLIGIALLYGVLHIGKERAGWRQLD
ncbi:MAG: hypothetical protein AAF458_13525 [Pseudomonadota bacterium]